MSDEVYKLKIPLWIVTIVSFVTILEGFFPIVEDVIGSQLEMLRTYMTVVGPGVSFIGLSMLVVAHVKRIYTRATDPHWLYSVAVFVSLIPITYGMVFQGVDGPISRWLFKYTVSPTHQTLFSMTAFYITTAAYRVFKLRNIDSSVLLVSGMIVLWSTLPVFTNLFPFLVPLATWILEVPNTAGYRAFVLGVSLGAIGLGLRIMLHKHEEILG